jgi:hypothetical protein
MKDPYASQRTLDRLPNSRVPAISLICAIIVFLTATTSNLFGDDTPKTICRSLSLLVLSVPPYDLSELSQTQQSNVSYYLEEMTRSNLKIPPRLNVLQDRILTYRSFKDSPLHFTLIFPSPGCEGQCIGTAILPGPTGFRMRNFSYHKNLVIRPGRYPFAANGTETKLGSLVLLDEKGRSLVAFHDVFSANVTNREPEEHIRSDYLRFIPHNLGTDLKKNYLACLQNVFPVDAAMPGSGAN